MKKYLIGLFVLLFGVVIMSITPVSATTGTPTCFFDQPGDHSTIYSLPNSNYVFYVPSDADASSGVMGWKSVSVTPGQAWVLGQPLDSSTYTATLSGGSFDSTKKRELAESNIQLNRSELFQFNKYTLDIHEGGVTGRVVTSCSVQFTLIPPNVAPAPGTPPPTYPTSGAAGKITFVKKLIQGNIKVDVRPVEIMDLVAIKDKFIADGECSSGASLGYDNLWVAAENGSSVTARNSCQDAALGVWPKPGAMGLISATGILPDWAGTGDSFVLERRGVGEDQGHFGTGIVTPIDPKTGFPDYTKTTGTDNDINKSILYQISGTTALISSVGPKEDDSNQYSIGLVALKNKIINNAGIVLGLPDWNKLGSIPSAGARGNDYLVGFGDYVVDLGYQQGKVYKIGTSSKTLVQTLPDFQPSNGLYAFDNSTWPSKLALMSWTANPNWVNNGMGTDPTNFYIGTIKVYTLGTNGLVLDKTLTVKGQNLMAGFGVWGKYVAIPGSGALQSNGGHIPTIELWDGSTGTKVDEVSMTVDFGNGNGKVYMSLYNPTISKGGYMAVKTSRGNGDNAVYLYKLNVTGAGSSPTPNTPTALTCATGALFDTATGKLCSGNSNPTPGSCTATLFFDHASVSYGSSMTETWAVNGADIGQVFGDCGAGEIQISAGPQSFTFNNLKKDMTCRVYGKINGIEPAGCSASATVKVSGASNPQASSALVASTPDYVSGSTNSTTSSSTLSTSSSASGSYNLGSSTLKKGSSGPAVEHLQEFLNGATNSNLTTDGKMGSKTVAAVKVWQGENGLMADGIVGAKTKAKIAEAN